MLPRVALDGVEGLGTRGAKLVEVIWPPLMISWTI
jgi:hypothetical protein